MNRRTLTTIAFCGGLLAAAAFVPTALAGNVTWGVSVGGPGYNVSVGQPGYYGGRGYYGAPYRPHYRPYYRPYFPSAYRPVVVAPPVAYIAPQMAYPYYAPAPVAYAPRFVYAPRPFAYGYPGYAPVPMPYSPNTGSY